MISYLLVIAAGWWLYSRSRPWDEALAQSVVFGTLVTITVLTLPLPWVKIWLGCIVLSVVLYVGERVWRRRVLTG